MNMDTNNGKVKINGEDIVNGIITATMCVLIVLKLMGQITASWWIVLLPLWIGPAILLAVSAIAAVILAISCIGLYIIGLFDKHLKSSAIKED